MHSVGLGGLAETFEANGVTYDILLDVTNDDLRDLNIPLGDRIRFRNALKSLEQQSGLESAQVTAPDSFTQWSTADFTLDDVPDHLLNDPWAEQPAGALETNLRTEQVVETEALKEPPEAEETPHSIEDYDQEPLSADELVAFFTDKGLPDQTSEEPAPSVSPSTFEHRTPSPIHEKPSEAFDWWDDDTSLIEYSDADDEPFNYAFDSELFEFDSDASQKLWDHRTTHFDPKEAKAQEKAAAVVSKMDVFSANEREFAQEFLTEFFTRYARHPTFSSVYALADQKAFNLSELREVVQLRRVWASTPKWWQIRRGGSVVTSQSFLGLSWPLALDVCRSRSDFPPEEMVDDNWYDEWRSLRAGNKGYVSFGTYVKEKIKYDQYGFDVDGIDGEDRFSDFYMFSHDGANRKRAQEKRPVMARPHLPEQESTSNEYISSLGEDALTPTQQYDLAVRFENGEGVEESMEQAAYWYMQAAPRGHGEAQCRLGLCYELGEGVEQDINKAIQWFYAASQQNLAEAHLYLALCLEEKSPQQALELIIRAAENGNSDAQFILGERYSSGDGQSRDLSKAKKWLSMAAAQGDPEAKSKLAMIEHELRRSAQDIYQSQKTMPNAVLERPKKNFPLTIEFNSPAVRNGDLLQDIYISCVDGEIVKLASKYDRSGEHRFNPHPADQWLEFDIYRENHSGPKPEKFLGRFRISSSETNHLGQSFSVSVFFSMTDIKISLSPKSDMSDLKISRVY